MPQGRTQIETLIAALFLTHCFGPGETIALLLRRESPAGTLQRILPLERVLAPRFLGWLAHENSTGANIYVAANPLRSGSQKRTKENVAAVRHLYIDIDTDGEARLAALRVSGAVPMPNAILSTYCGKYQAFWRVDGFDFERQESTLKLLAIAFGGDSACTDCNRVLRLPGFLNCKYDPAQLVTVEYPSNSAWNSSDFRLYVAALDSVLFAGSIQPRKQPGKHSNSENDWAWVSHELAHGRDGVKLTRERASRRADKANPLYYAQRTVDVASARLWLLEGAPIDDVITMLEIRRRFEITSALCSARAREIAATAQRMIARRRDRLNSSPQRRITMPLLEVIQSRQISASVRLDEATAAQVDQYAAFIHASADDVVNKALNYVFAKDRDFQEFLKAPQAQKVTPTLRIRRAAFSDVIEQATKKAAAEVESTESVRVQKA